MNAAKGFNKSLPDELMSWTQVDSPILEDLLMNDTIDSGVFVQNYDETRSSSRFSNGFSFNSTSTYQGNDFIDTYQFPPTTWSSGEISGNDNNANTNCRYVDNPFAFGMPWEKSQATPPENTRSAFSSTSSSASSLSSQINSGFQDLAISSAAPSSSPIDSGFQDFSASSYPPVFQGMEDLPDSAPVWTPSESESQPPIEFVNFMKAYHTWMRYKQRNSPNVPCIPAIPTPLHSQEDRGCALCKKNRKPQSFYSTHVLKDNNGVVICPVLREFTCPKCGATGDRAHTLRHCPIARKENHI
ncbi:nanos homolog 1-like [Saccostrea echinata]|uniref:nanos homolog 1-like n=1 Tax=Saccostrea echinata TaxID=191078 RepID=UPI002A8062A1|nr:nanos homolog 1-like [Saccostrea echinata]